VPEPSSSIVTSIDVSFVARDTLPARLIVRSS
jgi:hypothetical protein